MFRALAESRFAGEAQSIRGRRTEGARSRCDGARARTMLHAPGSTVIEGTVHVGKLVSWTVKPEQRKSDNGLRKTESCNGARPLLT